MMGVNQTIMAALSMVIIAAIIGGFADIGWEVLSTMRKAQTGQSLLAGTVIALTAVLTAAHCLAGDIAGGRVRTAVGTIDAASIHPIPSYREEEPRSLDVGVIITTENLPLPSFPILTSRSATAGEAGVIAGYGVD